MKISQRASRLALVAACLALLPTPAFAAEGPIEIEYGPDMIEWFPNTDWKLGHLAVTGPDCLNLQFEFHREDRIVLKPYDVEGNPLPDGVYSFDLRLGPGAEIRGLEEDYGQGQLCRGRRDLPSLDFLTSTGYVAVIDKQFVDPFKEEDRLTGEAREAGFEEAGSDGGQPIAIGSPGMVLAGDFADDPPQSMSAAATVFNGDLVARNSLCVGFDCPNSPTFDFDTIRLQENNLRIHFEDTSTASGFPSRDWRIVANDSASGGANKFSIEDTTGARTPFTIEGNARSNSLYIDDDGQVGFGTSAPVLELHVRDGDTPTLRLEQDTSSGFAAQVWDVAGNETNFFVRDVTGGSQLPFRIQPGAASNSLFIDSSEEVGIGTSAPNAPLHVRRTNGTSKLLVEEASGTLDNNRVLVEIVNNGRSQFRLRNTADASGLSWFVSHESNGNFGISREGTGQLEVTVTPAGNMIITGNYTPDYVFEPDYPLMPIEELAEFVARERHLPNVPNAEEVAKNGINVNDFPMALLEKIEELTLYTIEQHRTIETLKAEVQELKETAAN